MYQFPSAQNIVHYDDASPSQFSAEKCSQEIILNRSHFFYLMAIYCFQISRLSCKCQCYVYRNQNTDWATKFKYLTPIHVQRRGHRVGSYRHETGLDRQPF